jgi:hypothetical protein
MKDERRGLKAGFLTTNGYEDGEKRHHTPSLRATPLKRG